MPFIALDQAGCRIDITQMSDPRAQLRGRVLQCQLCKGEMITKAGRIVQAHFAHKATCPYHAETEPDTSEHRAGKVWVADWLRRMWDGFGTLDVRYEFHVPEVGRIVDVAAVFPSGWVAGCEVQLSATTTEQLEKRSRDYLQAGIEPVWLLGKKADTDTNRAWCKAYLGYGHSLKLPDNVAEATITVCSFSDSRIRITQQDRMKHAAIIRALEVWGPLSVAEIARACCLTTVAAKRSLGGVLGNMNVGNERDTGSGCVKKKGTKWSLTCCGDPRPWYKTIPLSNDAEARAKARARKHTARGKM